jgi:hypothetical protein
MDLYLLALIFGFAGLGFMAVAGLGHNHGGSHGHGGHDVGDVGLHGGHHGAALGDGHGGAHGHAGAHGHGLGHQALDHAHAGAWDVPRRLGGGMLSLLSPRVLSSVLFGFGIAGLALSGTLGGPLRFAAAVAGAAVMELAVVRPLWRLLSGFSSPARTLESVVMDAASAVTAFDRNGQGLVAIELDGQVTQILATLTPGDRAAGVRVRAGDRVLVEEVDAARNRCTVSHLGS